MKIFLPPKENRKYTLFKTFLVMLKKVVKCNYRKLFILKYKLDNENHTSFLALDCLYYPL